MISVDGHIVTMKLLGVENFSEYLKNHPKNCNAISAFFKLSTLSYDDKLKEVFRSLPQGIIIEIACRIAESVSYLYESKNLTDRRLKDCFSAARKCIIETSKKNKDAADAAYAAAVAAADATLPAVPVAPASICA